MDIQRRRPLHNFGLKNMLLSLVFRLVGDLLSPVCLVGAAQLS